MDWLQNGSIGSLMIHVGVIVVAAFVAITSFALLIPLDSIQAVTGVSIILGVAYGISILAWLTVMAFYSGKNNHENLIWLNTHLMFLVVLPTVIGATAMNVTTVQNTRNLLYANQKP